MSINRATIYLVLAILGAILPYWIVLPWFVAHGLSQSLFLHDLLINGATRSFTFDAIFAGVSLMIYVVQRSVEGRFKRPWIPILAVLIFGTCCGVPLFFYMLERQTMAQKEL